MAPRVIDCDAMALTMTKLQHDQWCYMIRLPVRARTPHLRLLHTRHAPTECAWPALSTLRIAKVTSLSRTVSSYLVESPTTAAARSAFRKCALPRHRRPRHRCHRHRRRLHGHHFRPSLRAHPLHRVRRQARHPRHPHRHHHRSHHHDHPRRPPRPARLWGLSSGRVAWS